MLKLKKIKIYFKAYLPSVLWASLIFLFSNQETLPGFSISILDYLFKKLAHIFVYAVLYLLVYKAYQKSSPQLFKKNNYIIPLLICFLYSLSDEIHQSFIPGRYATIRDMGYDMIGVSSILLHQLNLI